MNQQQGRANPMNGMTLRQGCVFAVAILGGTPATGDIWSFLKQDGWQTTRASVRSTLGQLRGAAVEITAQGKPGGPGQPTRWRLTEAARAWLAEGEPCGDGGRDG